MKVLHLQNIAKAKSDIFKTGKELPFGNSCLFFIMLFINDNHIRTVVSLSDD